MESKERLVNDGAIKINETQTKSCLTCKWEPKWNKYGGGKCEWIVKHPIWFSNQSNTNGLEAYMNKSDPYTNCPAYTPKEDS